jgi:hypothetical protein
MARPKGTPAPKADAEKDLALQEVISKLKAAGASQYSITIRAKPFGTHLWTIRQKGVAVDSVDDLAAYCAQTWGPGNDYRVEFWSTDGKPATDEKGRLIPKYDLPASETGMLPVSGPPPSGGDVTTLQQRDLDRMMREMELRRRRLEMEREKRRLERMEREELDEDEDDGPVYYPQFGLNGWQQAPWMQQPFPRPQQDNGSDKIAAAAITALGEIASHRQGGSDIEMLKILLPLMIAKNNDSGDVMKIMAPIMEMSSRAQADSNRFMLENTSEGNRLMMEQIVKIMKIGGEPDDKIDQFRKYVKLATDGLGDAAKVIFNRGSILPGKEIEVPRLPKPQTPGLPQPAPVPAAPQQPGKQDGTPVQKAATPADAAQQIIAQRMRAFLITHEQELLVESDPGFVVEKLEELWLALPASVREKIEEATKTNDLHTVYAVLGSLDEEATSRILKLVADDTTGKKRKWCEDFWASMAGPEEEEEEDDDDGNDGPDLPEDGPVPSVEEAPAQG